RGSSQRKSNHSGYIADQRLKRKHNYVVHIAIILAALIAMVVIAASIFVCYRFADWLARVLGETCTTVVIRLSAFLLLCIGVQIVWNGADALLGSVRLQLK